ncbi:hypothetical protein JL722_14900 [Aureococcus anophagefferens]|nr:hypothetical protein JL722_14900 [Aureococcus anophagefferens]
MSPQSPPDLESEFASLLTDGTLAIPVAAIQPACLRGRTVISVSSGSELFLRHVTRTFLEFEDFDECKRMLGARGSSFARQSEASRARIAELGHAFAAETKHFSVFVTEGRPDGAGVDYASDLAALGVPTTMILDTAVAYYMENVDVVLVGAEGVMENGGVINKVGTLTVATCAKAMRKPVYVAAESYKFARLYPLNQRDLPESHAHTVALPLPQSAHADVVAKSPACDYTPPQFITLLFTDLGILTPAAVSDELIRLYP